MIDLPMFWFNRPTPGQVPIIVDLQDVKISEMTNLPPKAKIGKEDKAASQIKRKVEEKYTKEAPKAEPEPKKEKSAKAKKEPKTEVNEEPQKPKKDFLVAPQPKKPAKKLKQRNNSLKPPAKPQKKAEPKEVPPKDKSKPELANPLKSLLASVDALEKNIGEKDATATIKEGTEVNNMGIEGGTGGSYFSELTISEMDALAGRLRACWNLDPGAMGIEDMIVEIRAQLNQDGTVRKLTFWTVPVTAAIIISVRWRTAQGVRFTFASRIAFWPTSILKNTICGKRCCCVSIRWTHPYNNSELKAARSLVSYPKVQLLSWH
ncbi:MAG: hypothetical protein ACLU99_12060 [Alphaproteobacteria bacterium]